MAGIFLRKMEEQQQEQVVPKSLELLRKHLKTSNLVFGKDRTMKLMRTGKISTIFLAANTQKDVRDDCEYYSKLSGVQIVNLEIANDELGTFCKKPFSISMIGLLN